MKKKPIYTFDDQDRIVQIDTTKSTRQIFRQNIHPKWIIKNTNLVGVDSHGNKNVLRLVVI